MNPNIIKTFHMSPQTVQLIDLHEKENFTKQANLFDRICRVLPNGDGESPVSLKYIVCGSDDQTMTVVFEQGGVENGKRLANREKGSLGYELTIHAMTTAVVWEATKHDWPFSAAYMMAQMLAAQIDLDDKSTLPEYVERITPQMLSEGQDLSFDVYRHLRVGETRSDEYVQINSALVRYVARPVDVHTSNNFHEIYPVLRMGNYVSFNSYLPFHAQILGPMSNESHLPAAEKFGLYFKDAVMLEDLRTTDRILMVKTGEMSRGTPQ